jgi:hypothetical protein
MYLRPLKAIEPLKLRRVGVSWDHLEMSFIEVTPPIDRLWQLEIWALAFGLWNSLDLYTRPS